MAETDETSFLSEETERKLAEFTAKLEAEQAAMPDTSIRSGTGGIDAPENYYFSEGENIPIYSSGLNKQIDRVDMKVDKAKRMRRTNVADEVDRYAREIHAQNVAAQKAKEAQEPQPDKKRKTAAFIYVFPAILVVFGIIVVIAMGM